MLIGPVLPTAQRVMDSLTALLYTALAQVFFDNACNSHETHGRRDKGCRPVAHVTIQVNTMNTGFPVANTAIPFRVDLLLTREHTFNTERTLRISRISMLGT